MGFWNWWIKTTFEGTIKKEIGEVSGDALLSGNVKIVIQELEKKMSTERRYFRLNIVFKALTAYQSMPVVLDETGMREFVGILNEALESSTQG